MSDDTMAGGSNPLQSFHSPSTSSHKQQTPITNGIDCDSLSSDCTDTTESVDEGESLCISSVATAAALVCYCCC